MRAGEAVILSSDEAMSLRRFIEGVFKDKRTMYMTADTFGALHALMDLQRVTEDEGGGK